MVRHAHQPRMTALPCFWAWFGLPLPELAPILVSLAAQSAVTLLFDDLALTPPAPHALALNHQTCAASFPALSTKISTTRSRTTNPSIAADETTITHKPYVNLVSASASPFATNLDTAKYTPEATPEPSMTWKSNSTSGTNSSKASSLFDLDEGQHGETYWCTSTAWDASRSRSCPQKCPFASC